MKNPNIIAKKILMAALLPSIFFSGQVFSAEKPSITVSQEERNQERGWFMYNEDELTLEEKKKLENSKQPPPKEKKFTTEWFKENLPKYHNKAIDSPTDRNILAYEVLQRIMLERSYRYAQRTVEVYQKFPALDGNTYDPGTNAGFSAARIQAEDETKRVFAKLKNRLGLWFFFDDSRLSQEQEKTMKVFKNMYPIEILPISVNGARLASFPDATADKGHSEKLGLNYFPAVLLVDADTKSFYPVTFNHVPLSMLTQKILQVARTENMITDVEWQKAMTGGQINPFMEMVHRMQDNAEEIKDVDGLVDHFMEIGKMGHGKK